MFSQNFLTSPHWARRMVDTLCADDTLSEFWEIGPGLGALTGVLLEQPKPVRVFEIDRSYIAYLKSQFRDLLMTEGDALTELFKELPKNQKIGLVSNLPYHLSSAIFFKLLEHRIQFPRLVLTFQKEFASRLIAVPNTKAYGGITVQAQLAYDIRSLGVLGPDCFYPRPDVSSQSLLLTAKEGLTIDWEALGRITRLAFGHRRKKMIKNLSSLEEDRVVAAFGQLGWSHDLRAEQLAPTDFLRLCQAICPADTAMLKPLA